MPSSQRSPLRVAVCCATLALALLTAHAAADANAGAHRLQRLRQRVLNSGERDTQSASQRLDTGCVDREWGASAQRKQSLAAGLTAFSACMRWSVEPAGAKAAAKAALTGSQWDAFTAQMDTALYSANAPTFTRDAYGRPTTVVFSPMLTVSTPAGEVGKDNARGLFYGHTSDFVEMVGYAGDNAGHIVAYEFGGSNFANNFWPASPNCNQPGSNWRTQELYVSAQMGQGCATRVTVTFRYADPDRPFRATHGDYAVQSAGGAGCVSQTRSYVNVPTDKGNGQLGAWMAAVAAADPTGADVLPLTRASGTPPAHPVMPNAAWQAFVRESAAPMQSDFLSNAVIAVMNRAFPADAAAAVRASGAYAEAKAAVASFRGVVAAMRAAVTAGTVDKATAQDEVMTAAKAARKARDELHAYIMTFRNQIEHFTHHVAAKMPEFVTNLRSISGAAEVLNEGAVMDAELAMPHRVIQ